MSEKGNHDNLSDDDGLTCELAMCEFCGERCDRCECGIGVGEE